MSNVSTICSWLLKSLKFSSEDVKNRFPISKWICSYNLEKLRGDVISGIAVGLMVVPQSLAIASLAGLPTQHGLYSSFPGVFIYCLLGTSKDLNVGPTVLSALMVDRYNPSRSPQIASLLTFICGIVLLLAGLLKVSFIVEFISRPVFSGFISGAAIAIIVSQLRDLLGLQRAPRTFFQRLKHLGIHISNTRAGDAVLGMVCLVFLVSLHFIGKRKSRHSKNKCHTFWRKAFWYINVGKSAIVAIIATAVAYAFHASGYKDIFILAGELRKGLPDLQVPLKPIQISLNKTISASDVMASFGSGIALVPLVLFIESIAVAEALAIKNRYHVDATQELIAVGLSNVFASFCAAMPVTGCVARSAVNSVSGAATPASGIICGIIVLLAIQFITPVFKFVPMAALAAMVIAAVITMIEIKIPRKLWRLNRADLLPFAASFCGSFYELEVGIMAGALVNLLLMLYRELRPRVAISTNEQLCIVTMTIKGGVWFPATSHIRKKIRDVVHDFNSKDKAALGKLLILIECQHFFDIDFTVAMGLKELITELQEDGVEFEFVNIESVRVKRVLQETGLIPPPLEISKVDHSPEEEQFISYETNV